jgi:steroid 5-alpha reductase family enzyme
MGVFALFILSFILFYKNTNFLLLTFLLDVSATILIFFASTKFNNSSMYDPYWSLAPVPILLCWYIASDLSIAFNGRQYLIITITLLWSVRLTYNWIRRWKGLNDEDWRYSAFRKYSIVKYWIISFFGFHLFPTLIVFFGCLSIYPAMCLISEPIGITDLAGICISLCGIIIEWIADKQLSVFKKHKTGKVFLSSGLWKYLRHPNYLGEITFWSGLFVFSLSGNQFYWYTLPGPIFMILMFTIISAPMMDKRMLAQYPGYKLYMKNTFSVFPWFKKRA